MLYRIAAAVRWGVRALFLIAILVVPAPMFSQDNSGGHAIASHISTTEDSFKFDVASIKKVNSGTGDIAISNPPRSASFSAINITLKRMVQIAYGLNDYQVSGGPKWFAYDGYDVQAKADSSVDQQLQTLPDQEARLRKRAMLQALLKERTKLEFHRESKELAAYVLLFDKKAPGLHESPTTAPNSATTDPVRSKPGFATRGGPKELQVEAKNVPIAMLATQLSAQLGMPIVDETGLTGVYDFTLQWSPEATKGMLAANGGGSEANGSDVVGVTMFDAIHDQLGLKVKPSKAILPVLVVDQVDPPSEN